MCPRINISPRMSNPVKSIGYKSGSLNSLNNFGFLVAKACFEKRCIIKSDTYRFGIHKPLILKGNKMHD